MMELICSCRSVIISTRQPNSVVNSALLGPRPFSEKTTERRCFLKSVAARAIARKNVTDLKTLALNPGAPNLQSSRSSSMHTSAAIASPTSMCMHNIHCIQIYTAWYIILYTTMVLQQHSQQTFDT